MNKRYWLNEIIIFESVIKIDNPTTYILGIK